MKHSVAVPCDEHGVDLRKIDGVYPEPLPPKPKAVDDWSPFESQDHFKMAEFLYCRVRMSGTDIDTLMSMVAEFRDRGFLFKDHSDLYNAIDASDLGGVSWKCSYFKYDGEKPNDQVPGWMTALYEVYYRDPRDVIKNMIGDTAFKNAFDYTPFQEFDENGDRRYENLMSGDWAFRQAVCFILYFHQSADPVASTGHHRER